MNRKTGLASIVLFCSILVVSCKSNQPQEQSGREDRIPVKLQPIEKNQDRLVIRSSGLFSTDDETVLSFKNGGIIRNISVKEGDAVRAGQLLATLNLTEIEAGVQLARLSEEKAERDFQRAYRLYQDSVVTLEQMQNSRTALDVARQQLKAAEFNRKFSEIRATVSGYVLQRYVEEGQVVGPGTPVLLINGAHKDDWVLKVGVSDRQWAIISTGDKAVIRCDVVPDTVLQAYVFKKEEGIDPSSGTFTIHLKISDKNNSGLASGLFARADIFPSSGALHTWVIPYDALLEGDGEKGYVFVTNDCKVARKVEVTVGDFKKNKVLITSGFEQARYLVVSGSPYLDDGSEIKVQ